MDTPNNMLTTLSDDKRYPQKRYASVILDPPWSHYQHGKLGAASKYSLMTTEQIAGLPIPDLLTDDAHVWIWVTVASRFDAQRIAEECWGLKFRSELIWDKRKTGLGNYLRGSHESLLLFSKGRAPIRFKAQRDVADWPVQDHSHKPEEALVMIQRCSPGPYLEMFARARFPGVEAWGLQAPGGSDVHIPGYPVPVYSDRVMNPTPSAGDPWSDGVIRKAA